MTLMYAPRSSARGNVGGASSHVTGAIAMPEPGLPVRPPLPDAPELTFVFTDIERSTRLLEQLGGRYGDVLAVHAELVRGLLLAHRGHEVDTQGDAFFCVFVDPADALAFCAALQRRLAEEAWPEGVAVRLRIGVHTGTAALRRTGYVGMDVHEGARVAAAGHGGQVLVTDATATRCDGRLPSGLAFQPLGSFRLKDIRAPVALLQLTGPELVADCPPPRTLDTPDEPPAPGEPPYLGLAAFEEADAARFFGREALVQALVTRLEAEPFLAIVGASGSGKSSLVRAGLMPALRRDGAASVALLTPTEDARSSLEVALAAQPVSPAVVVVDQLEELFTLERDEAARDAFVERILALHGGGSRLIVTLRADFYDRLAPHDRLRELVAEHQEYLGSLTRDELRRAVEGPAELGGWRFDPGLVDLILHDVGDEPGALPLLSHAIRETWGRRQGTLMTLRGYLDSGGVQGAIARTADETVGPLEGAELSLARDILLRLTELGEDAPDTRRRAPLDELVAGQRDPDAARAVLDRLVAARLVVLEGGDAEVAHEALIREWPTLRAWLEDDREGLRLHRMLTLAARDWEANDRDPALLLRGARLAQAREWADRHPDEPSDPEREFLAAGLAAELEGIQRERRTNRRLRVLLVGALIALVVAVGAGIAAIGGWTQAQDRERQAELARADLADSNEQLTDALDRVEQERTVAVGRQLVAQSLASRADHSRSTLLALEGLGRDSSGEAWTNLNGALDHAPEVVRYRWVDDVARGLAASPDGSTLATISSPDPAAVPGAPFELRVYTADDWRMVHGPTPAADPRNTISGTVPHGAHLAFSLDGSRLAYASPDGVAILDIDSGETHVIAGTQGKAVHSVTWAPSDGRLVWVTHDDPADGPIVVWTDPDTGTSMEVPLEFDAPSEWIRLGYLSPDARWVIVEDFTGDVDSLFDAATGEPLGEREQGFRGYASDGSALAAGVADGLQTLALPDLTPLGIPVQVQVQSAWAEPDPAMGRLFVWPPDHTLSILDTESGFVLREPSDTEAIVTAIASAADGRRYVARDDGSIAFIDVGLTSRFALPGGVAPFEEFLMTAISGDGRVLARWNDVEGVAETEVEIIDAGTGEAITTIRSSDPDGFLTAALSEDGSLLFTIHASGELVRTSIEDAREEVVATYDLEELGFVRMAVSPAGHVAVLGETLTHLLAPDGAVSVIPEAGWGGADFLPDGSRLYVTDYDAGVVHVIDVASGEVTGQLETGGRPTFMDLSADGSRLLVNNVGYDAGSQLQLYDVPTGERIGAIEIMEQAFSVRLEESTGDRTAVTPGFGGSRWDVDPESWLRRACDLVGRNLSASEWATHLGDEPYGPTCEAYPSDTPTAAPVDQTPSP